MIILSDTDVVHKLACCELLLEFLQYLKCPPNEVWVLPSLSHMLKRKLAGAPTALKNVEQFIAKVRIVPPAKIETLQRFPSLDVGEQQLVALLCDDHRVTQLVTGDKRAMIQISALAFGDKQLEARLQATTLVCFEAIMLGLLAKRGFGVVQARIQNKWIATKGQQVDGAIKVAFPIDGTEAHALETLQGYVAKLKHEIPHIRVS